MTRVSYDPDSVLVGILGRPHGLSGEVTLRPYNQHGTDLAGVSQVILEQDNTRISRAVRSLRRGTDGWLLRLEGADSRDDAAALVHLPVRVPKRLLPRLAPGEFYVEDLLGCRVVDERGVTLGVVESVFWNGAQDVMSVVPVAPSPVPLAGPATPDRTSAQGGGEVLIPVVPAFVLAVDTPGRQVVVSWDSDG